MLKKTLLVLLIIFVIIQFFRPEKNISAANQPQALKQQYAIPASVESLLQEACYDCHSNNTRYLWCAEVQPVAWYLADHVKEGKAELNFDEFLSYPPRKQDHKLEEVVETQEEGSMPLSSYIAIHTDANLTPKEKHEIIAWAKQTRAEINYQGNTK